MRTLNVGEKISNCRILSVISQSNSEIVYNGYNLSDSTYVIIQEFCPKKLNIKRVGCEVFVDDADKAEFDRLATAYKNNLELCNDNKVLSINNTLYVVTPKFIDTAKRDEIFARLEKIDKRYEYADSKGKSKLRLSALADYEDVMKTHLDLFYLHSKSVNNLADCYFYEYYNDALSVNKTSEVVKPISQEELNKKAFDLYLQSAYRGSAYAQHQIGFFYDKGYACLCNYKMAAYWYREAYNNGYIKSAKRLGDFYFYSQGVEQSYEEAVKYYEAAAECEPYSCLMLVKCYEEELGVKKDDKKIFYYLNKAYESGNRDSDTYIKLAKCYLTACGTDENLDEANKFIKKAALSKDTIGVSDLITKVYLKKKRRRGDKFRCFLYKALSYWDIILALLLSTSIISVLIYLCIIYG